MASFHAIFCNLFKESIISFVTQACVLHVILHFITGRNEVVAKVIFLHLSVILFTGEAGCLPQCMLGYHIPWNRHPLGSRHPTPEQTPPSRSRHPSEQTPTQEQTHPLPRSRAPQEQTPPEQTPPEADTPLSRHPPGSDIPPGKQTLTYGQ